MNQRARFLIELLDKLGAPLMGAVQATSPAGDGANPAREAEMLAALLGQSVQLGLSVAQKLDLKDDQGDADAVRLSLSAMAGRLVGDSYRLHGRLPGEAETGRMTKALEAVLTFADNFTPSAEHSARLRAIGGDKPLYDITQSQIFYLSAMEPVLAAIAEFPFGQGETKLIQDTAQRLQDRAGTLREAMVGASADRGEATFAELMILHTLARIYADCHRGETARLVQAGGDTPPALEPVWKAFDVRLAMLETLLNAAVPGADDAPVTPAPASTPAPQAVPAQPVAPPAEKPNPASPMQMATQPVEPPAPAQPPTPPAAPPQPPAGDAAPPGSPMGFFTQKPQQAPVQTPPGQPAAPSTPATAPPADGNPMAFFKPGVQKQEDSGGQ